MANTTTPAGSIGGLPGTSMTTGPAGAELAASLPARVRVHALAKLLSVSSKEVMAALTELGIAIRSPQSSIDRETALRALEVLLPDPASDAVETEQFDLQAEEVDDRGVPGVSLAPVFNSAAPVFLPPVSKPAAVEEPDDEVDEDEDQEGEAEPDGASRRPRRRGRRGRGRGKTGEDAEDGSIEQDDNGDQDGGESSDQQTDDRAVEEPAEGEVRRRRRRRRRRDVGDEELDVREDDPPDTVVHVREITDRPVEDEVQAIRGSTRLEAKRQRRRDGREAGRRRAPILSESEFLTRREAVE